MIRLRSGARIVPYASSTLEARALSCDEAVAGSCIARCSVPHVVVDPARGDPLRLNDAPYDFTARPAPRDAAPDTEDLELLRVRVEDFCGLWAGPKRRFVASYFDFVVREVERNAHELERRLSDFGGLYRRRDWVYSALAPLPRAWLHAPRSPTPAGPLPAREDFVPVDFAFWTGTSAIAVYVTGSSTATSADRERRERLVAAAIDVIEVPSAPLRAGDAAALEACLPDALRRFWEGEPFPSGPFCRSHLGDPPVGEGDRG